MQVGDFRKGFRPVSQEDGAAGHHLVVPAGQEPQHGPGLLFRPGLAQDGAFADHDGVRGDDDVILPVGHRQGLQAADPGDLRKGSLAGVHGFIDIRCPDDEGDAEEGQKLLPAGGSGS